MLWPSLILNLCQCSASRLGGASGGSGSSGQPIVSGVEETSDTENMQLVRIVYSGLDENVTTVEHHWRLPSSITPQLEVYHHDHELMAVTSADGAAVLQKAAAQLIRAENATRHAMQQLRVEAADLLQTHFQLSGGTP